MKHHLQNAFLLIIISFLISIIFVALAVAKTGKDNKQHKYQIEHFSPMRIHQKH